MAKAFKLMKKYQIENNITCGHAMKPEIAFLLGLADQTGYQSKRVKEGSREIKVTLFEKMNKNRPCKEKDFCRDEIYYLYKLLGDKYANKKADDIFNKANTM